MSISTRKTTLITGASGGIGYELAYVCAAQDQNLVLVARNSDKLLSMKADLEAKFSIHVNVFSFDLSQPGAAKEIDAYCKRDQLVIDHLVNNAGFGDYKAVGDANVDVYTEMLNLNVVVLTELTTIFVKQMIGRGYGRILNVASTAAYQPVPNLAVYSASKSYVVNFTEALHGELKDSGVSATVLSPGPTDTGFRDRAAMNEARLGKKEFTGVKQVAEAGFTAMMKGRLYSVPGWKNKLLVFGTRFMPSRSIVLAVSGKISRQKG